MNRTSFIISVAALRMALCFVNVLTEEQKVVCQKFRFEMGKNVVDDHAHDGHVIERYTVKTAAQCHMMCRDNCLCLSINYLSSLQENNCELNDAVKKKKPEALKFKSGAQYYDLVRMHSVEGGRPYVKGKDVCVNRCCQPNPCFQGAECVENCDPDDARFTCSCSARYTGQRCEHRCYKSCKDAKENGIWQSGRYLICNGEIEPFYVYCEISPSSSFIWTLLQSFAIDRQLQFSSQPFTNSFPVRDNLLEIDWGLYRLSLARMKYLAEQSTHLRVTCNYNTDGLQYTDYAQAELEHHNLFATFNNKCRIYEHIAIRGNECRNCTALTNQPSGHAWHIDSYLSSANGCNFDGRPGMGKSEHNFGWYAHGRVNTDHRCSSSPMSTTQHWFGIFYIPGINRPQSFPGK